MSGTADDSIAVLRAASRVQPQGRGVLQLNFSKGIVLDNNEAARSLERLRKVIDPRPSSAWISCEVECRVMNMVGNPIITMYVFSDRLHEVDCGPERRYYVDTLHRRNVFRTCVRVRGGGEGVGRGIELLELGCMQEC